MIDPIRTPDGSDAASLRQARHALKLWDQAESDHGLVDVAASSMVQPIGDMAEGFALAAFGRRPRLQRTFALTKKKLTTPSGESRGG